MQYNREFHKLARFAPGLVPTEKDRVKRFFAGLKPIMRKDLSTHNFSTHAELLDKALKLEKEYNQLYAYHNHGDKKRPHPDSHRQGHKPEGRDGNKKRWSHNQKPPAKFAKKCANCGRDHDTSDCRRISGACFKCGEKGHMIANCPKGAMVLHNGQGQNRRPIPAPPQRTQGRVFALTNEEAFNSHDVVKGSGKVPM